MAYPSLRSLILALALPVLFGTPARADDQDVKNDCMVVVVPKRQTPDWEQWEWKLSFVAGQGAGDLVNVLEGTTVVASLKKAGDSVLFLPDHNYILYFKPNAGDDGSKYVVKLNDRYSIFKDPHAAADQYVTFKAEKPASTLFSRKKDRRVTLAPDWGADTLLHRMPGLSPRLQQYLKDHIADSCHPDHLLLGEQYFGQMWQ